MNIGEFARRTGLSVSALRFYGDRGLLEPAGIDPSSGYRSYSTDQVEPARVIADLRRMDMPLAEIERVLQSSDTERSSVVLEHVDRLETAVDRAHIIAQSLGAQPTRQETTMTDTIPTPPMTATLEARSLGAAIEQILPAAGRSPSRPHLMCVLIEAKDGSIRLAATDSHRLSIRDVPAQLSADRRAVVAAESIRSWVSALDTDADAALTVDARSVAVTEGSTQLDAAVVPVTFPDYESILIPSEQRSTVKVAAARHELLGAFESFDGDDAVLLSTTAEGLTLQRRETHIDVAASCSAPDAHVALNASYAADALRAAVGAEAIIEIADAVEPVIFRSADDGTYTSLLMPVKLD